MKDIGVVASDNYLLIKNNRNSLNYSKLVNSNERDNDSP